MKMARDKSNMRKITALNKIFIIVMKARVNRAFTIILKYIFEHKVEHSNIHLLLYLLLCTSAEK